MRKKTEIHCLQMTLKKTMAARHFGYQDLADELGVSLSTAKRLLNQRDPSFEKILDVCSWLGLEFDDVSKSAKSLRRQYHAISGEQERFLARNLGHLALLRRLHRGETPEEIAQDHGLSGNDVSAYLQDLEDHDFLRLRRDGTVKLLVADGMDWSLDGPLRNTLLGHILRGLVDHYLRRPNHGPESFIDFGHKELTASSYEAMKKELDDLSRKYGALARVEAKLSDGERPKTYSYVMLFDEWQRARRGP